MNKTALLTGAVVLTAAVASTIATVTYQRPTAEKVEQPPVEQPQPAPTSTPSTEKFNPPVATSPTPASSRQPITLVDESVQSPEFAKFLDRTKQAVRDRDAKYIRSIVTPATRFSFGEHRSINYLNPDNPKSPFWTSLEKALSLGCSQEAQAYSCPTVFHQFDEAIKKSNADIDAFSAIVVVGQNVNVRSQPQENAAVIATLTNEIVKYDMETFQNSAAKEALRLDDPNGWTPIVLPNDKRGYVSSRYAYSPVGYRVFFGKEQGEWKMQAFVSGD